ncbi:site-specific integrase [Arcobacter lacus]|uniref:tyrosine-type recombinase/integrase n=1 Tax=Arcobacteraceae TaxID=2808963 RepID=UPI0015E84D41|nr:MULTISPECIES: site-specific integrase [Arcobacteraceae]MCT7432690.1 site-specific integrase [Aliarcobacter cryaerophilus]MCT7535635.1 site-specific integrase [Aliarcobacter cryaerophilus]MCT7912355.1 site-specific integrase [Arcobacter lacus]
MAIDRKIYINEVDIGLKANEDYKKFYFNFKINSKIYSKLFDYSKTDWDKRTRIAKAKAESIIFKNNKVNPKTELDENIKFEVFIKMHFDNLPNTAWTATKKKHYEKYIKKYIGNKKVTSIKQMHIKDCIKSQEDEGLAPRTVKTTLELLNPVFKEAIANRLIDFNPCTGISVKVPKTKKTVLMASDQLANIYKAIHQVFENNPYYLSFYLFALQGRRKSEILNLKWEKIDFENNRYILEDTKNGEHQMFFLPPNIKNELLKFRDSFGWVYSSSSKQGNRIINIEKQTKKLKDLIPNFTLHYMRNVIVSAMAEQGVSATLMSGALGHNNTSTLSKYLSLNHVEGSIVANKTIEGITTGK